MNAVYETIGRIVVGFVRLRYRKQLRVAGVLAVAAAIAAGYLLSSREVEEG
ncbi:MAG TPA: hypothetical protein VKA36_05395 [Solirubrobacterales bacterium]|nr:hypothetical protein [Solirubrobacterales bacterium]